MSCMSLRGGSTQITYLSCLYITVGRPFSKSACKMPQVLAYCLATQTHRESAMCLAQVELIASRLLSDVVGLSKEDITCINGKELYSSTGIENYDL